MILPVPKDTIILTVNLRLARWLRIQDSTQRKQQGHTLWETPGILPIGSWLQELWESSWPDSFPLSELQVQTIWENILNQDMEFRSLDPLSIHTVAKQVSQAYKLLTQYRIPRDSQDRFKTTDETRHFWRWMHQYERWLDEHSALDPSHLMDGVKKKLQAQALPLPQKIVFAGLDDFSPQFKEFVEFLSTKNVEVSFYPDKPSNDSFPLKDFTEGKKIELLSFNDRKQETRQCARWIRKIFSAEKTIGIVAMDLENYRTLIEREFRAELAPESILPQSNTPLPFDISLGPSLSEEPLIRNALALLKSTKAPFPLNSFVSIAQSPYFLHSKNDRETVLALISSLKKKKYLTVDFGQAKRFIPKRQAKQLTAFLRNWESYSKINKRLSPGGWSTVFSEFLKEVGWPARYRTLSSREHQCQQAWNNCMDSFASLDTVLPPLRRQEAIDRLSRVVEEQAFQEKTEERSIEVLGSLEAAGQQFDALWVLGCHADALPSAPGPNPFLPITLQKQHDLPHSSPAREMRFAQTVLKRLTGSANEIIFSYPASEGEQELTASSLLKDFQKSDTIDFYISDSNRLRDQLPVNQSMEFYPEEHPVPVSDSERSSLSGGYRILKNQADCPFRAFAAHRLFADRIPNPETDFDPVDRGNLIHRALEIFWINVRNLEDLKALNSQDTLGDAIEQAVNTALGEKEFVDKWKGQEQFRKLEQQRIIKLLEKWMEEEQKRDSFKVVEQEKKERIEIEGVKLQLRIDRIDEMENGDRLLIDYKTGNVKPQNWFGDRIKDPQLPLYASKLNPRGIAFAQVKKGSLVLSGVSDTTLIQEGMKQFSFQKINPCETWDELMDYWNRTLIATMQGFLEGKYEIDPVDGDDTCRYCDMGTLCRIEELKLRPEEGKDA